METTVRVIDGDVVRTSAEAMILTINPSGKLLGGLDGEVRWVAGDLFHAQAKQAIANDREVRVVVCERLSDHHGRFATIIFVIDDGEEPLHKIVRRGLIAASSAGIKSVSMPPFRLDGLRAGGSYDNHEVGGIVSAIKDQVGDPDNNIQWISIVVYGTPSLEEKLNQQLVDSL